MSLGADVWGYVTGVLSVLAVIFQLIRMNLPSTKLKEFEDLLRETEALLHEADEEGLLDGGDFVHQTNETLENLRGTAYSLRAQVHVAKTIPQQCLAIVTGLSVSISFLCSEVKEVRAEIATTSEKARETLRQLSLTQDQQEARRNAPELLNDGQVSDMSSSGDASLSADSGRSASPDASHSQGDEAENKTLNEVVANISNDAQAKALTYDGDTIHEAIEIVEEACTTAAACEAS